MHRTSEANFDVIPHGQISLFAIEMEISLLNFVTPGNLKRTQTFQNITQRMINRKLLKILHEVIIDQTRKQ